jgi:nucleoside-diphosphate-sugar epimerase
MLITLNTVDDLAGSAIAAALRAAGHTVSADRSVPRGAEAAVLIPTVHADSPTTTRAAYLDGLKRFADEASPDRLRVVVFLGSLCVFGDRPGVENRQRIDDNTPIPPPGTAFEETLRKSVGLLRDAARLRRLPVCVLRTGIPYAGVASADAAVADGAFRRLLVEPVRSGALKLPGGGANNIAMLHTEDLAAAVERTVAHPEAAAGRSFVLADGHDVTLADVAARVADKLGAGRPAAQGSLLSRLGFASDAERMLGYQQKCEPFGFRREFGWSPRRGPAPTEI